MSHFTVLVIGENVDEQLKPFDENLRVEFKDVEPEYRKKYETDTTSAVRFADGKLVSRYDDILKPYWQRANKFGTSSEDKLLLPAGATELEISVKELYPTFDLYMSEYGGYERDPATGKYGYTHNPKVSGRRTLVWDA
jgi:hypothetical protein